MENLNEKFDSFSHAYEKRLEEVEAKIVKSDAKFDTAFNELTESFSISNTALESRVVALEEHQDHMKNIIKQNISKIDELEQYGRRNCLVFHGIAEAAAPLVENTDEIIMKTVKDKMGITLSPSDIGRSHRLGKRKSTSSS